MFVIELPNVLSSSTERCLPSPMEIATSVSDVTQDVSTRPRICSLAAGFQLHLTKPVLPDLLRTTIDSLLANRATQHVYDVRA
jgi:hypothetical protein